MKGADKWFKNIILLSDTVDRHFVDWLHKILAINGTIIQIYSNKDALFNHSRNNFEKFIRYSTPSQNIQNYYLERDDHLLLLKSQSFSLPYLENKQGCISICDFNYVRSNLTKPGVDFHTMLCKESNNSDATSAHNYFCEVRKERNLFDYLINQKPFPYFTNLCKWTKDFTNCKRRNTLIINENSEIKLCWYGQNMGTIGQSYDEIISNFESMQKKTSDQRKCNKCKVKDNCNICISPFPVSDKDYCIKQNIGNLTEVAELFMSFDVFKQYMNH